MDPDPVICLAPSSDQAGHIARGFLLCFTSRAGAEFLGQTPRKVSKLIGLEQTGAGIPLARKWIDYGVC
ncbi:MAG: hypothetical protein WAO21_11575 [Verrucomicrobiia bacterium]